MCDTLIALASATRDGSVLLSKNSDREPDEAQALLHLPRQSNADSHVQCTFIEIPQVAERHECILSKPFQMWGAEMGVNEWGLAIGNEAVFTKVKIDKRNTGLTGMDMLRLALERCKTASEAVACITSLLERYGQDACGGYRDQGFYYHNSFLIADPTLGWVLETAGKVWAAEKVKGIRSISNRLSVTDPDQVSASAKTFAQSKGWWNGESSFNFREAYSDWFYTRMGRAARREACTARLAAERTGLLSAGDCMNILQTHNLDEHEFKPRKANTGSVCMHATSLLNPSQTTGSMVAELRSSQPQTVWLTGTSMPCLSVYLPFFFRTKTLDNFTQPSAVMDKSLWWRAEGLHRWICKDYQKRKAIIHEERMVLQQSFLDREKSLLAGQPTVAALEAFSGDCLSQFEEMLIRWYGKMGG